MASWIEIIKPAPVLNTPDFHAVFKEKSLPLDGFGHPLAYEFVALPQMQFKVLQPIKPNILQIQWPTYSDAPLFIDSRFCNAVTNCKPRIQYAFDPLAILNHMERRIGTPYVWGGNWADGIPEMLHYYPPTEPLSTKMQTLWTMQGLDCSGLLFEASNGTTPRNTSHLLHTGRSLLPGEPLEPLDMIIYPGHVLFVRTPTTIIESKFPFGVRVCPLKERWDEISQERTLAPIWNPQLNPKTHFTVRRF